MSSKCGYGCGGFYTNMDCPIHSHDLRAKNVETYPSDFEINLTEKQKEALRILGTANVISSIYADRTVVILPVSMFEELHRMKALTKK